MLARMTAFFLTGLFFCSLVILRIAMPFARLVGLVDHPGGRKRHEDDTPLIGGLVIIPMFVLALFALSVFDSAMASLLPAMGVIYMVGLYDDRHQIHPWVKFLIQTGAATYLVLVAGAEVRQLGDLFGFGEAGLNILSIPFSIAALVLFMNALNMMDGLDGLAGGMAAVIAGWLAFAAYAAGQEVRALQLACLLAPLFAFLSLNMRHPFLKRAQVFLGDAGSLSLAVILGWFAIDLSQAPGQAVYPVGILWLLAIPVIDTLTLFFIRTLRGRHPFSPDRNHLHHRFLDKGVPIGWVPPFIVLVGIACGSAGIQAPVMGVPQVALLAGWLVVLGAYVTYSLRPGADRTFA